MVIRMKNKKKKVIGITAILLLLCLLAILAYLADVCRYQNAVKNLTYTDIALDRIADGSYEGECNVGFIYAKVAVTVEKGRITQIELLEHKNERGASAEKITEEIIELQTIDVDAVSGATNSSKVIRKAVENALAKSGDRQLMTR